MSTKRKNLRKRHSSSDEESGTGEDELNSHTSIEDELVVNNEISNSVTTESPSTAASGELPKAEKEKRRVHDMGATAESQSETEFTRDKRAIFEKSAEITKKIKEKGLDDIYRGANYYVSFVEKRDSVAGSAASQKFRAGPVRAATNIRNTCRFDYQMDVCKDYKESGTCGFGDSCKFVHDRGDYKTGWELDKEWEQKQGNLKVDPNKFLIKEEEKDEDDGFICPICHQDFANPIVTKCHHYFCEKCALEHHKQNNSCYLCAAPTHGQFSVDKTLLPKLKERKLKLENERRDMETAMMNEVVTHHDDEPDS